MASKLLNIFSPLYMSKNDGPWGKKPSGRQTKKTNPTGQEPDLDDMLRQAQDRMRDMMGGGRNGGGSRPPSGGPEGSMGGLLSIGAILAAGFWVYQCFYIVQPEEQGVVTRFGQYIETNNEGLHFHLWPIEQVVKPKVTRENILEVGFRSSFPTSGFGSGRRSYQDLSNNNVVDIAQESLMLTGDENIVDLDFTVRWVISNPRDYLFKVDDPVEALKNVAESAVREVIGRYPIDDAITSNKLKIEQEALQLTQKIADEYGLGMRINNVELQQVQPPKQVLDAFRDVQAAKADAEKEQDLATGYANDVVPRARGQAAQVMQEAEAYKQSKIAEATGNAARFESQLAEYVKAPAITRKRLYLENMEEVLKGSRKVIMTDKNSGGILPYLPLNTQKGAK
ncbi:MAG: FtsH protease activity modulator HflK [Pseudomonadota bacterium]|nr:FtsH protease activity modulator HflK [Pseudomonadota bacterium]